MAPMNFGMYPVHCVVCLNLICHVTRPTFSTATCANCDRQQNLRDPESVPQVSHPIQAQVDAEFGPPQVTEEFPAPKSSKMKLIPRRKKK